MPHQSAALQDVHVLVIDDDERERHFLRAALEVWGALVTATTATEASGAALAADVIVCDLESAEAAPPGLLDRLVRAHAPRGRSVATIALVQAALHPASTALAAGFHRHLTKPVRGDELRALVHELTRSA